MVASPASDIATDTLFELKAAVAFQRRGVASKLVLPGRAEPYHSAKCDPALIKAVARGHLWFEELATGRARSLHELATREGITRRYIRRLVNLAFLSPQLVQAILRGRQPIAPFRRHGLLAGQSARRQREEQRSGFGQADCSAVTVRRCGLGRRMIGWVHCPDRERSNQCHKRKSRKQCNCWT